MGDGVNIDIGERVKDLSTLRNSSENLSLRDQELLAASLDIFYGLSQGDLWSGPAMINGRFLPDRDFPNGSCLTFLPVTYSPEKGVVDEEAPHRVGIFTFTDGGNSPEVRDTLAVECNLTLDGHDDVEFTARCVGETVQVDQLVGKIADLATYLTKDMTFPVSQQV